MRFNEAEVRSALARAWSLDTAKQWEPDTPASREEAMQCVKAREYDVLRSSSLANLNQQDK